MDQFHTDRGIECWYIIGPQIHGRIDWVRRTRTWGLRLLAGLALLTLLGTVLGVSWLRNSLPRLDGTLSLDGVQATVEIQRDDSGLVHIEGETRADIAFALGFAHAQDRFFQMDLQRRSAAGELSELFGEPAVSSDEAVRLHRFRDRAQRHIAQEPADALPIFAAYANGVNAGLSDLGNPPFEYALLGVTPEPWKMEDSLLTLYSMILVLPDRTAYFERALGLMADILPPEQYAFFSQQGGEWDAPLYGEALSAAPVPQSGFDSLPDNPRRTAMVAFEDDLVAGSNNWAVSGQLTDHGSALVANDMHLPIRVPNTWYRASWTDPQHGHRISGVTLPGAPNMVAGSNERLAWGFTNTQGDWSDVVLLEETEDGSGYLTPEGNEPYRVHREIIEVKDAEAVTLEVRETRWGPVIGRDHLDRALALRWVAHDHEGANGNLYRLEQAGSVHEALQMAPTFGMPHQNFVMGDADGSIAWTIGGAVPRRVNLDGRHPTPWHTGDVGWQGYLDFAEHPRVLNPESGRIWTANSRVASDTAFEKIGMQGAALGARQQQIRDVLLEGEQFDEAAMLALQLDDRAVFLQRWRDLLLELLDAPSHAEDAALSEASRLVRNWSGRAAADDPGYRLVRYFRQQSLMRVLAPLEQTLQQSDPAFRLGWINRQMEYPGWALIESQPPQLLNPAFDSWQALLVDAARAVVDPLFEDGRLDNDTWGDANRLSIHHPMSRALPPLAWWLSMPAIPMSGDTHMPRVQTTSFGASERFAVAPGRESEAYLHMATGQSAHPLSPFFDKGHEDWVDGRASAWLPDTIRHRLQLKPLGDSASGP